MRFNVLIALVASLAVTGAAGAATKPVTGSISGPVTSTKGAIFKVKTTLSPTGTAAVSVGSKTVISEQVAVTATVLKKGACVVAMGKKSAKGVVTAQRVTISPAVKGACDTGFGGRRPGGTPPAGGRPSGGLPGGGFGNNANFGFAFGQVTSVKGTSIKVKGRQGTTSVTVPKTAQISETEHVGSSSITVKSCVFVQGTSTDKGKTVKATSVNLTKANGGKCTFGRRTP